MNLYIDKILELLGAGFSLYGVWALTNGKSGGWLVGLVGIVLSALVCYMQRLFGQAALQIYFFLMSVYGWYYWRETEKAEPFRPITRFSWLMGILSLVALLVVWQTCGYLLEQLNGANPGLDALIASMSIIAQFWQSRKLIACWPLWAAVNVLSCVLFLLVGNYTYTLLYLIFLLLSYRGWLQWKALSLNPEN